MREFFYSKINTCLLDNFKLCGHESDKQLTEKDIVEIARKVEYNIICSTKAISRYRFLTTQKVNKILFYHVKTFTVLVIIIIIYCAKNNVYRFHKFKNVQKI